VEQSRAWQRQDRAIQVSVNVSPESLGHDLVDRIGAALSRAELSSHLFHVELTELRTTGEWSTERAEAFERLQQLGVSISIDDFGQGESSLWRLASLPVDVLKIDRGFIASMTDDRRSGSVVRSATELAHTLEMSAVAEGVETPEQWHALRAWGCDFAQGFLLGRPVAAEAFMAALESDVVPTIEQLSEQVVPVDRRVGPLDRRQSGSDRRQRGEGTWPRGPRRFARR
jgi:EAL domain-containing protein (putative c-di-GMP-specific phosphodiesterase class I)